MGGEGGGVSRRVQKDPSAPTAPACATVPQALSVTTAVVCARAFLATRETRVNKVVPGALVLWWLGGLVARWLGGLVAWLFGGSVAWWLGALVAR